MNRFDTVVFNFSNIYLNENFYRMQGPDQALHFVSSSTEHTYRTAQLPGIGQMIDVSDMSGTDYMCDDIARESICRIIEDLRISPYMLHYIDNGNYHYMSALTTQTIEQDFCLQIYDHHPDMQVPSFGDILSCGGWVLDVLSKNKYCKRVYINGADPKLIAEVDLDSLSAEYGFDPGQVHFDEENPCDIPTYLSIDKDVLATTQLMTNWDQGDMKREQIFDEIGRLVDKGLLLGVDVCGEPGIDQLEEYTAANDEFNRQIMELVGRVNG